MVVTRGKIRSCLLSPREAARLMGVSDDYILPTNYNEAAAPQLVPRSCDLASMELARDAALPRARGRGAQERA